MSTEIKLTDESLSQVQGCSLAHTPSPAADEGCAECAEEAYCEDCGRKCNPYTPGLIVQRSRVLCPKCGGALRRPTPPDSEKGK